MQFSFSTIVQYHASLQAGSTTCTAAVSHYLQQIEAKQHLNALVAVFAEEALQQAAQLDAHIARDQALLPLHGVVVAIKDVLCLSGQQVTAASLMLKNFTSLYTATAVQRLLDAGAIIIGVANCDEFAMGSTNEHSAYGPVLNSANTACVPGGSSGGSAVAVQAGLCMVSLGSDTGGSVRQPAGHCGVFGFKPGYGTISRYGLIAYASSFDCIGIFAHNLADIGLVYNQIAGPDPLDSTCHPEPHQIWQPANNATGLLRLACLAPTLTLPGLDPIIKATLEAWMEDLRKQGHTVDLVPFDLLEYIVPTYYVLTTAEASSNLNRYDGVRYGHQQPGPHQDLTQFYKQNRSTGFGTEVKRRIMLGSFVLSAGYYDAYFTKAQQVRQLIVQQTAQLMGHYDALLMPISPTTAPLLGQQMTDPLSMYLADIYTVYANLAGMAGMALPLFTHTNGMPFGVQVMTKQGQEVNLLHLCQQIG